jgi:hypothetical protein
MEPMLRLNRASPLPAKADSVERQEEEEMFAKIVDNRVYVRLSRRNLRQLEAILDNPDVRNECLARMDENGVSVVVQVENDADHYEGRDPGPGVKLAEVA